MKVCKVCNKDKDEKEFHTLTSFTSKLKSACIECEREKGRRLYRQMRKRKQQS